MALLGRIDSFDLKTDSITEYIEKVEQYFIANDITNEKKQTAIFLTITGNETLIKKFASTRITGRKDNKNATRNINRRPKTPAHNN